MVIGSIAGIATPAGPGWDFGNFYDTGHRAAAGQINDIYDPLTLIAGKEPQGKMRFWGPPISAYLYMPMSWFRPETAMVAFKIENVLAFAATFVTLFLFYVRFAPDGEHGRWQFAAVFTLLCLIYQPFWTVFRVGGQTTPTVLLLLTIALILHTNGHFKGSAVCVCLATLIKPAMAPILVFLLCVSGGAFFWTTGATLGVVGLASLAWLGWPIHMTFLSRVLGDSQATFPWYANSSLYIVIDNLRTALGTQSESGVYQQLFAGLGIGLKIVALGTVIILTRKSRTLVSSAPARRHFDFLMAISFFLLWSGTIWEHYLAVLFPLLAYVVATSENFSRRALVLIALIFVLSIGQNLILTLFLRDHFRFESLGSSLAIAVYKSGPLLLTAIFLWRHNAELYRSYAHPAWRAPLSLIPELRHS